MNIPYTAIRVASVCVPSTASNRIRAGRIDQNGPRVRVRKIVRMSGHRQHQVHHRLQLRMVEVEHLVAQVEQAEGGDGADDAEHRGDPEHQAHVPGLGLILVANVVVGDGQDGAVVEQRQHHDLHRRHGKEVEDQDARRDEQQHPQRLGDAVDRVAVHPLEDLPALLDRVDDHRQSGGGQHDGQRRRVPRRWRPRRRCRSRPSSARGHRSPRHRSCRRCGPAFAGRRRCGTCVRGTPGRSRRRSRWTRPSRLSLRA